MKVLIDGVTLIEDLIFARTIISRMRGLLGRDSLPPSTAMLIERCGSIHTFGMRFSLDVIFLDRQNKIVKVARNVRPGRMVLGGRGAKAVIEMQSGHIDLQRVSKGRAVEIKE